MNWIDYSIFAVLFFAAAFGFTGGPLLQLMRITGLLASFFVAVFFYSVLGSRLNGIFTPSTADLLSYFIVFTLAFIAAYIVTDVLRRVIGKWVLGIGLRLLGTILGILKGLVFCGVIIFGVVSFCGKPACSTVRASPIASSVEKGMQAIVSVMPQSAIVSIKGYVEKMKEDKKQKEARPDKSQEGNNYKSQETEDDFKR